MKVKSWLPALALLFVLVLSFWIHALPASLPAVPEASRDLFRDGDGEPYLTEMDSYFHLRYARQMAEEGSVILYSHRGEDPLMDRRYTPDSGRGTPLLLSVLAYGLWRFFSLFGSVSVLQVARWMGPVFASLAAIPAFWYVRRRTNLFGGAAAALLVCCCVPFVSHTHAGFFDTDLLLALLPLTVLLPQLRAAQARSLRAQCVPAALSGLAMGLLSLTWATFYTYFWLQVLGGLLGGLLVLLCGGRCPFRRRLLVFRGWLLSLAAGLLFIFLFSGTEGLRVLGDIVSVFRSISGSADVFPYGYQFTGEMTAMPLLPEGGFLSLFRADLSSGLGSLGGLIPCLLALFAVPLALAVSFRRKKESAEDASPADPYASRLAALTEAGLLLLWLFAGVYLMRGSRRFAEIAALPVAVLAGLSAGFVFRLLRQRPRWLYVPACLLLLLGAGVPAAWGSAEIARAALPGVTDPLALAMDEIRETRPENAAIAAWWDDGYYMQYASRRRAFTDGGTSSGAVNYYLAHALLSDDPARMTGLFRMLETSGAAAPEYLVRCGVEPADAAELLLRLAPLSREAAAGELPAFLTAEQREALLDLTHPREENPILLVLSSDLLRKLRAVSWYGFWDPRALSPAGEAWCTAGIASAVLSPGSETVFRTLVPDLTVSVRTEPSGLLKVSETYGGRSLQPARVCLWRDGRKVQDLHLSGSGPAVVLVEEEGRTALFCCTENLCDTMLVRLLVCADQSLGLRLSGTWYGRRADPCPAQCRLFAADRTAWSVQLWE